MNGTPLLSSALKVHYKRIFVNQISVIIILIDFIRKAKDPQTQCLRAFPGGDGGIRTHVGLHPNGFQDRLVMTASIQLRISILFLFSSTFARKTCKKCKDCNYRKVCKTLCCKGLRWMSRSVIWNISRPPRYDRFDTAPCGANYNRMPKQFQILYLLTNTAVSQAILPSLM